MNIREFSSHVKKIYEEMSSTFSEYQTSTGWNCLPSCGRCCLNPEVEASLYEMLPMALSIFEEGSLEEWIEKLSSTSQESCLVYVPGKNPNQGQCGRYKDRPSLCRMFAVSGFKNKNQDITLSICSSIKEEYQIQQDQIQKVSPQAPLMIEWSYKLASLDQRLIQDKMPINQALLEALEKVALYATYQELPSKVLAPSKNE
jgi:Fe-S-cluster containining protein